MAQKIKTGDKVQIIAGKDRTKKTSKGEKTAKANQGKVTQVLINENKLVVEGLNVQYKHLRPRKAGEKGQKIEYPSPLDMSNVMLVCPKCNQPVRVGFQILDGEKGQNKKVRVCKKCHQVID